MARKLIEELTGIEFFGKTLTNISLVIIFILYINKFNYR